MNRIEKERRRQQLEREALSRRDFLWKGACAAVGTTALLNTIWDLRMVNAAAAASVPARSPKGGVRALTDYKALVCVFLYGGNDANNLLIPTDNTNYAAYAAARGALAIPQASALPIVPNVSDGRTYGFHPSCAKLQTLFQSGKLAVLCNTGTLVGPLTRAQYLARSAAIPPALFSHNDQQVQWQTSIPDQQSRTGWGGRCADLLNYLNGNATVSMSISLSGANTWEVGNVVSEYNVSTSGPQGLTGGLSAARVQAMKDLLAIPLNPNATGPVNLYEKGFASITDLALRNNALLSTALSSGPTLTTVFPTTSIGNQLKMIARLIGARTALSHTRQIFFASAGGYDLHDGQVNTGDATTGAHANLLGDLSNALKAFYDATVELGVANNVTAFTASDFGRTFPVNGATGSDHGWGNHQLVVGGPVIGKQIYGTFPALQVNGPDDTGLGRWIPTTSVDEYSATLAKWYGVSGTNMPAVFPNINRFAHPDLGFMAPG